MTKLFHQIRHVVRLEGFLDASQWTYISSRSYETSMSLFKRSLCKISHLMQPTKNLQACTVAMILPRIPLLSVRRHFNTLII